ncbi:MAG TPA: class I SAM-dependent methyltransferase [Thermoanaerobaculia bacterium]|nr:class I SAM-dependent methyltransferase [Thermoanaerobaculia bacterium]
MADPLQELRLCDDRACFELEGRQVGVTLDGARAVFDSYDDWKRLQELKGEPHRLDLIWETSGPKLAAAYEFAGLAAGESVLEVGFRTGHALRYLHSRGVRAMGLEVNLHAVEHALALGMPAFLGDVQERTRFEDASFDAIVLRDVLEHLFAPAAALGECLRLLTAEGRMLLEVPLEGGFGRNLLEGHASLFYSPERFETFLAGSGLAVANRCRFTEGPHDKYRVVAHRACG